MTGTKNTGSKKNIDTKKKVPLEIKILSIISILNIIYPLRILFAETNLPDGSGGWLFVFMIIPVAIMIYIVIFSALLWTGENFARYFLVSMLGTLIIFRLVFFKSAHTLTGSIVIEIIRTMIHMAIASYLLLGKRSREFFKN